MKVQLTYFKPSGKYYTSGQFEFVPTSIDTLGDVWDEVRRRQASDELPDIMGGRHFYILVRSPDDPHDHPKLILPLEVES